MSDTYRSPATVPTGKKKEQKKKGCPHAAGKKARRNGGLWFQIVMSRAANRRKARQIKRENYLQRRRATRLAISRNFSFGF
jgi:hypothetical protein